LGDHAVSQSLESLSVPTTSQSDGNPINWETQPPFRIPRPTVSPSHSCGESGLFPLVLLFSRPRRPASRQTCSQSGRLFFSNTASPTSPDLQSLLRAVAQLPSTASVRLVPGCAFAPALARGVPARLPEAFMSPTVAVGHRLTAPSRDGLPADRRGFSTDPDGVTPSCLRTPLFALPYLAAVCVGQSLPGVTPAMGRDPRSVSLVRGADMLSTHHERPAGVAFVFQVPDDPVSSSSAESR